MTAPALLYSYIREVHEHVRYILSSVLASSVIAIQKVEIHDVEIPLQGINGCIYIKRCMYMTHVQPIKFF